MLFFLLLFFLLARVEQLFVCRCLKVTSVYLGFPFFSLAPVFRQTILVTCFFSSCKSELNYNLCLLFPLYVRKERGSLINWQFVGPSTCSVVNVGKIRLSGMC